MSRESTQIVRKVFDRPIMPEEIIESIKEENPDIQPIQEQFFTDMLKLLQNSKRKNGKVVAIPAPCGIGKSIFIKHYLKLCTKNELGLIVITDNIERLDNQYDLPKEAKEKIFMCRMETSVIAEKYEIFSHPVIMMTSQKFFGLSDEARELLYTYDIFDGTADVYPLYEQDCIQMYDCDKYRNKLDLSINFVKVSTSKSRFNEYKRELGAIADYIQESKQTDMPLVMTYANYINSFKETSKALAYFGNIKGFNEYKELTECYHIGINRYEPIV